MAVRPILRLGHPLLRQVAAPVTEFATPSLRELVHDMLDTMRANDGAGLAAIQIGVLQRVVVFELERRTRAIPDAEPVPLTVLVNPEIELLGDERELGLGRLLERARACAGSCRAIGGCATAVSTSSAGRSTARSTDFHARVVQHECDHLDGILYPQRIEDMTAFGFQDELVASGVLPLAAAAAD